MSETSSSPAAASERRAALTPPLESGESTRACLELDLDAELRYARQVLVLTDRRLLAGAANPPADGRPSGPMLWKSWAIAPGLELTATRQGPVGTLQLDDGSGQLACWRYTCGLQAAAEQLARNFTSAARGETEDDETPWDANVSLCAAAGGRNAVFPAPVPGWAGNLARLTRFAKPHAGMIACGFVLTLAATAIGLAPPYLTMPLLDRVLVPYQYGAAVDFGLVAWYLAGLAVAAVLAWLLDWARKFVLAWVSERISADLRTQTYAHLQRLSLEFFGGKRTGDLISRVGSDTDRICNFLSLNLIDFATDLLMIGMAAGILVSIDPLLALVTLCPFPPIVWLTHRVRGRLRRGFQQGAAAWSGMTSVLADTIPGIRVVKAFAQERREIERFAAANGRVLEANDRINRIWSFFGPLVMLLTSLGLLIVWACGAWRVAHHQITVGVLTAFVAYIGRFYGRIESMILMVSATQRAAASAQRLFEVLDRVPGVPDPPQPVQPGRLRGEIRLEGVRFKYGSREILDDVNLSIRPGEMLGLVGPSGAGKSTLINLICRFYDVTSGAILVDGVDIRSFAVEAYRRHVGVVLQDPFLFYGTVAENIAYGRPEASREEIVAAARAARAHEFILRLPDGYDSLVGERGQSLSGGERQRISIARALLTDPRILILDEATSSVDTQTEREIQAALENLVRGRTTIAIAHRLSTLRRADRLVVLEGGRIVEIGNHDQLLQASGTYARLHRAQLEAAEGLAV